LSRSTLLYYDRIGVLRPSGRTGAGYRCYTGKEQRALARICELREAGLSLRDIRAAIQSGGRPNSGMLERRMRETSQSIVQLKQQQRLLAALAGQLGRKGGKPVKLDKKLWVAMLRAAGMDERGMARWHAEFEQRAPEEHREFLLSLGLSEEETARIRRWAGNGG
jgi:DNA-binding transcriptional MerR regulator